jgi:hypothetical protein
VAEVVVWPLNVPPPETLQVTPALFESLATEAVSVAVCAWSIPLALEVKPTAMGWLEEPPHPERLSVRRKHKPDNDAATVNRFTNTSTDTRELGISPA